MRILLTGTPGVGKTTIAKALGKKLKYRVINEKEFAVNNAIGLWSVESEELFVPIGKLQKGLSALLAKQDNVIIEGHLLCEIRLKVDAAVLLRLDPEILEARLEARGYTAVKAQDNIFCEGIDYCKKHLARRYAAKKIIEVKARKTIKETIDYIIDELGKRGKL